MKVLSIPIECSCKIQETENGYYQITLNGLPHPCEDGATHSVSYSGKTIEEMGSNLGLYFSEYLKKEVSDVLGPAADYVRVP